MIIKMTLDEMEDAPKEELENYIIWLYQYIDRLERRVSKQQDVINEHTKDTTIEQRKAAAVLYAYGSNHGSTVTIEPQLASLLGKYFEVNHESALAEIFNRYH